jgi:hypothetical protein
VMSDGGEPARTSRFLACINCHAEDSADKTERAGGAMW